MPLHVPHGPTLEKFAAGPVSRWGDGGCVGQDRRIQNLTWAWVSSDTNVTLTCLRLGRRLWWRARRCRVGTSIVSELFQPSFDCMPLVQCVKLGHRCQFALAMGFWSTFSIQVSPVIRWRLRPQNTCSSRCVLLATLLPAPKRITMTEHSNTIDQKQSHVTHPTRHRSFYDLM